jgi:hypothetical protein
VVVRYDAQWRANGRAGNFHFRDALALRFLLGPADADRFSGIRSARRRTANAGPDHPLDAFASNESAAADSDAFKDTLIKQPVDVRAA